MALLIKASIVWAFASNVLGVIGLNHRGIVAAGDVYTKRALDTECDEPVIQFPSADDCLDDFYGNEHCVSKDTLNPVQIYDTSSSGSYEALTEDATVVRNKQTGELIEISCFERKDACIDIFICFHTDNNIINHGIIKSRCTGDDNSTETTYLERVDDSAYDLYGAIRTFSNCAANNEELQNQYQFSSVDPPFNGNRLLLPSNHISQMEENILNSNNGFLNSVKNNTPVNHHNFERTSKSTAGMDTIHRNLQHTYIPNDGSNNECTKFIVIAMTITYDSYFCSIYDNHDKAQQRIREVFSLTKRFYEDNMCLRLLLDKIVPLDNDCTGKKSIYENYPRKNLCDPESDNFLNFVANDLSSRRNDLGIRSQTPVAHITGENLSGVIGCAYKRVVCSERWGYSVLQLGFSDDLETQAHVLTHEFAHNMGMNHYLKDPNDKKKYLMEPAVHTDPDMQLSQISINTAFEYLNRDDVTCDYVDDEASRAVIRKPLSASDLERINESRSKRIPRGKCMGGSRSCD